MVPLSPAAPPAAAPPGQQVLELGPLSPAPPPRPGQAVVADRPRLGRCLLRVRGVHATAITADRLEVLAAAARRGEATPRTRPTTLAYGTFRTIPELNR